MIVSLIPRTDFAPVPRIEVRLVEEVFSWDAGGPDTTGPDLLDGGGAGTTGSGFDAGLSTTVSVELLPGTDRVTVWRECAGRSMKVRGAVSRSFSGSLAVQDVEPSNRGVVSTYEVECFASSVSLGRVPLGSTVLPKVGPLFETIIQQPLDPHLNVVVEELEVMAPSITRVAPGGVVHTEGNRYPQLVGSGPRRGVEDVELAFLAKDRVVAGRVWATQGDEQQDQLPVMLIRSSHPLLPPVFFCEVLSLTEQDVDMYVGGEHSRFTARVREIAPPAPALVVAALSYADINASFASYVELNAAFTGYPALNSAWEYAGAAG